MFKKSNWIAILVPFLVSQASVGATEGRPAPELSAVLLDGSTFQLSKYTGKVVLIHFWATWCEACQLEMPLLEDYYLKHKAEGFEVVAFSMDKKPDQAKVREIASKFSFKVGFTKEADLKGYGRIWKIPLTFVIDRKGVLAKDGWDLGRRMTVQDLDEVLLPLLSQKGL